MKKVASSNTQVFFLKHFAFKIYTVFAICKSFHIGFCTLVKKIKEYLANQENIH